MCSAVRWVQLAHVYLRFRVCLHALSLDASECSSGEILTAWYECFSHKFICKKLHVFWLETLSSSLIRTRASGTVALLQVQFLTQTDSEFGSGALGQHHRPLLLGQAQCLHHFHPSQLHLKLHSVPRLRTGCIWYIMLLGSQRADSGMTLNPIFTRY